VVSRLCPSPEWEDVIEPLLALTSPVLIAAIYSQNFTSSRASASSADVAEASPFSASSDMRVETLSSLIDVHHPVWLDWVPVIRTMTTSTWMSAVWSAHDCFALSSMFRTHLVPHLTSEAGTNAASSSTLPQQDAVKQLALRLLRVCEPSHVVATESSVFSPQALDQLLTHLSPHAALFRFLPPSVSWWGRLLHASVTLCSLTTGTSFATGWF
jgi:hypothetical protein